MWIQFSAYAAGSADSTSDCMRDSEWWAAFLGRSATWRGKHSHARVWARRLKKGGWMMHLSGAEICESCPWTSYPESTTSPEAIHASLSAPLVDDRASKTRDTCGLGCSNASRLFDLEESSSRTSQGTSRWGCSTSCPTWKAAVTERRGAATRRRLSALPTDASESSSSGWPTPTASHISTEIVQPIDPQDPRGVYQNYPLETAVNWPTPTVTANQTAPSMQKHPGCRAFWPTPDCTMRPHEGNVRLLRKGVEQGMDKAEADAMLGRDIGKPQGKLAAWPTPVAGDSEKQPTNSLHHRVVGKGPTSHPGQLNPDWVEMLMGFPVGWTDCAPLETQ